MIDENNKEKARSKANQSQLFYQKISNCIYSVSTHPYLLFWEIRIDTIIKVENDIQLKQIPLKVLHQDSYHFPIPGAYTI